MKPTLDKIVPLMLAYKNTKENGLGGSLHIVLADGNIKNSHINWCIEYAKKRGDIAGVHLGNLLLLMSTTQRRKLSRIFSEI